MAIHRMRTIGEACAYIREADPGTAVTPNCIQTLCKEGKVNCVFTGKKALVDLDHLLEIICGEVCEESEDVPTGWMLVPQKITKEL